MGLRIFTDDQGSRWRVWQVDTPAARAHLMDVSYRNGWLVFEREDGSDRRRLAQVPEDWESMPPERLLQLSRVATPAPAPRTPGGGQQATIQSPTYLRPDRGDR